MHGVVRLTGSLFRLLTAQILIRALDKFKPSIAEVHYSTPGSLELSIGVVPLGFGTINGRLGR